jgi:hypothetical protein
MIFMPVDLAVETDEAPSTLSDRCGESIEGDCNSGLALAYSHRAHHRGSQRTFCGNLARLKAELPGLLEMVVLDVPRAVRS